MFDDIFSIAIKIWHKLKVLALGFLPVSTEQKLLIAELRQNVRSLPQIDLNPKEEQWVVYQKTIRENILNKDLRNFLNWGVIRSSMFHEAAKEEFDYLQHSPRWAMWRMALKSPKAGNPRRYSRMLSSNGNLIHNAFLIEQLFRAFGTKLSDLGRVVEFGGGYGAMAWLFNALGFRGDYVIYDLPEFSFLQEYYLRSAGISPQEISSRFKLRYNVGNFINTLNNTKTVDLFIVAWSVSECPLDLRDQIFKIVNEPKYYVVGYKNIFGSLDNVKYFQEFTAERQNYGWAQTALAHLPGNYLLLGRKND
jgi:hypothetical protein